MDKPLHPAYFKKKVLNLARRCIKFHDHADELTWEDVLALHYDIDGSEPQGLPVELLELAEEKIFGAILQEDLSHNASPHLFSPEITSMMEQFFRALTSQDETRDLLHFLSTYGGKLSGTTTDSHRQASAELILRLLVTEPHSLPFISGYEGNVRLTLDVSPKVRMTPLGGEADVLLTLYSPSLAETSPREKLSICFAISTSSSMEESHKLDDVFEGIRNSLQILDSNDYLSIVTFNRSANVVLRPFRVGILREEECLDHNFDDAPGMSLELSLTDASSNHSSVLNSPPNLDTIFSDIRTLPASNLCEGLEQAFTTINSYSNDGPLPPDYRRVIILISDGNITEGIRDPNLIGAVVRMHCSVEPSFGGPDSVLPNPPSVSTIRAGQNGQSEDEVMRMIASRGCGNYFWAPQANDIAPLIIEATMGWKERTSHLLSVSFISAQDLHHFLVNPNTPFRTECTQCSGYSLRQTKVNTTELIARIRPVQEPYKYDLKTTSQTRDEVIKTKSVEVSDLVSEERRRFLFTVSTYLDQNTINQPESSIITQLVDSQDPVDIGGLLISFCHSGSTTPETVFVKMNLRVDVDQGTITDALERKWKWVLSEPPQTLVTLFNPRNIPELEAAAKILIPEDLGEETTSPSFYNQLQITDSLLIVSTEKPTNKSGMMVYEPMTAHLFGLHTGSPPPIRQKPSVPQSTERLKLAVMMQLVLSQLKQVISNYIDKHDIEVTLSSLHSLQSRVNAFASSRLVVAQIISNRIRHLERARPKAFNMNDTNDILVVDRKEDIERSKTPNKSSHPSLQAVPSFSMSRHHGVVTNLPPDEQLPVQTPDNVPPTSLKTKEPDGEELAQLILSRDGGDDISYVVPATPFTDGELFMMECNRSYTLSMMLDAICSHTREFIQASHPTIEKVEQTRTYQQASERDGQEREREKREQAKERTMQKLSTLLGFISYLQNGYGEGPGSYIMEHRLESMETVSVLVPLPTVHKPQARLPQPLTQDEQLLWMRDDGVLPGIVNARQLRRQAKKENPNTQWINDLLVPQRRGSPISPSPIADRENDRERRDMIKRAKLRRKLEDRERREREKQDKKHKYKKKDLQLSDDSPYILPTHTRLNDKIAAATPLLQSKTHSRERGKKKTGKKTAHVDAINADSSGGFDGVWQ
ncbi:hypothetical protein BLNAU_13731 [Blattamonas nauphoetae]|uniref:VWFA domain-containing protein n=1 Tax=Blattamonas nauphoetae TaxID=2049346 RepID=A0ABQ9XFW2_9EUKA|nr:hypothetical protein BLNAU_13731 [Blattamonas nauphoetae]